MYKEKHKVIDFKTVSPLFEMERDGKKYFTERLIDPKDIRFKSLFQWLTKRPDWLIRITNPATGEQFVRHIVNISRLCVADQVMHKYRVFPYWMIIEWDTRKVEVGQLPYKV